MVAKRSIYQRAEKTDCVTAMHRLPKGSAQLISCDPPFNIGHPYDAYEDNKSYEQYMAWTREWIAAAYQALHKHGSFWIFAPDEWVSEIDVLCKREFHLRKRNHIVWTFTFGVACQKKFSRSHCHILYYTKAATKFTFNAEVLRVPSARQLVYNDKRQNPKGKLPDATWMLLEEQLAPHMTPDRDTWLVSRICGTFKERQHHSPNQIPLPVMERIVLATSNKGDLVVDPCCGTGSTGVACALHERNFIGYDVSDTCVKQSLKRIEKARLSLE